MVEQTPTPHPMQDSMLKQLIVTWRKLKPLESPWWKRVSDRNCSLWKTPVGAICSWRTALYPCWSSSRNCRLWEGTMLEQGNSRRRKEQQRLIWTEHNTHSLSPCTSWSGGGWRVKTEIEPGKKGCIFSIVFISHYLNLLLIDNKLNQSSSSQDCLAHDSNCWVISLSLSQPTRIFILHYPHLILRMDCERGTWCAPVSQARLTHHTTIFPLQAETVHKRSCIS